MQTHNMVFFYGVFSYSDCISYDRGGSNKYLCGFYKWYRGFLLFFRNGLGAKNRSTYQLRRNDDNAEDRVVPRASGKRWRKLKSRDFVNVSFCSHIHFILPFTVFFLISHCYCLFLSIPFLIVLLNSPG